MWIAEAYVGIDEAYVWIDEAYAWFAEAYVGIDEAYVGIAEAYAWIAKAYVGIAEAYVGIAEAYAWIAEAYAWIAEAYVGFAEAYAGIAEACVGIGMVRWADEGRMLIAGLPLPQEYMALVVAGRWPRTNQQELAQNGEPPLISAARVQLLAPEESRIYLFCHPPRLVAERATGTEREFWNEPFMSPSGIDINLSLLIGDFGLGSDAPILLDYRCTPPRIVRLLWGATRQQNRWVTMAEDFRTFAGALDLWNVEWPKP